MKSILIIFLLLTSALQAVEVKEVASISFSGKATKVVTITVPEDTAELILVLNQRVGPAAWQSLNPIEVKQREKFRDSRYKWLFRAENIKFYRPEKGKWHFYARGGNDGSSGSFTIYAVPYLKVEKPRTIAVRPHRLCDTEYIKVIFPKDIVTPTYLEGVYGFEITTKHVTRSGDVTGYGGVNSIYWMELDGMRIRVEGFEESFEKNRNYYFEIKTTPGRSPNQNVRINWYKAKIQAVAGVISPNRELWMVTHGRDDNPDNADSHVSFRTLAGTISNARLVEGAPASSMVLNWSEGAADNSSDTSLEGSRFIKGVAQTAKRLLDKRGVTGGSLNLVGHSWGSLVSDAIGSNYPPRDVIGSNYPLRQVARIVALDPAESGTVMGLRLGRILLGDQSKEPDFIRNAHGSLAIVTGKGLFGSERRAQTAHVAIRLDIPSAEASAVDEGKRHALPVDTFYQSILERGTSSIASKIWSLALKTGSNILSKNTPRNVTVTLPSFLSRPGVSNPEEYLDLTELSSDQYNFNNHDGVIGIHVNQAGKYSSNLWMGIGIRPDLFTVHSSQVNWFFEF